MVLSEIIFYYHVSILKTWFNRFKLWIIIIKKLSKAVKQLTKVKNRQTNKETDRRTDRKIEGKSAKPEIVSKRIKMF